MQLEIGELRPRHAHGLARIVERTASTEPDEGLFRQLISYDLDEYASRIFQTTTAFPVSSYEQLEVDSPNRRAYKRKGGKLIS